MLKDILKSFIEEYINDGVNRWDIINKLPRNAREKFEVATTKRLKIAYDRYKGDKLYKGDFLVALRNFLLVLETDIKLDTLINLEGEEYNIFKDDETGSYYTKLSTIDGINIDFLKKVYSSDDELIKYHNSKESLMTDPLIYMLTGFKTFKSMEQKLAVYGVLKAPWGFTTLVSLPTGGGKSLITQVLAYENSGLTIVVVPTVSLAMDQERVAKNIIHTENPEEEIFFYQGGMNPKPIIDSISNKKAKILFISPEALVNNAHFLEAVDEANNCRYLKNIIVDEAHMVIDWGASFRVDFQCLEPWRKKLIKTNPNLKTVLLSATYDEYSIGILKKLFSDEDKWIEIRCDSLRKEPLYGVIKVEGDKKIAAIKKKKLAVKLVKDLPHPIIVYVSSPYKAEEFKRILAFNGLYNVKTFTGDTGSEERKKLIEEWSENNFEIMVATSAFGVGVDKGDVRTVLHLYVPQNANAYYQELGRGGRDGLPSLSVMCITMTDVDNTFTQLSKKVLTTEKIQGRWNSMFNNVNSKRSYGEVYIDTAIKPKYNDPSILDEDEGTKADVNWNIYVLLLLRRYGLIDISEIITDGKKIKILIKVKTEILLNDDELQYSLIDTMRNIEWNYHMNGFKLLKEAIDNVGKRCWSEMFTETYDKVCFYCAGCNEHDSVVSSEYGVFQLKNSIASTQNSLNESQIAYLHNDKEIIVFYEGENIYKIINNVMKHNLSMLVGCNNLDENLFFSEVKENTHLFIVDDYEITKLGKMKSNYYLSGLIAVVYNDKSRDISKKLKYVEKYLRNNNAGIIHLIPKDVFLDDKRKTFSEYVDGLIVPAEHLIM